MRTAAPPACRHNARPRQAPSLIQCILFGYGGTDLQACYSPPGIRISSCSDKTQTLGVRPMLLTSDLVRNSVLSPRDCMEMTPVGRWPPPISRALRIKRIGCGERKRSATSGRVSFARPSPIFPTNSATLFFVRYKFQRLKAVRRASYFIVIEAGIAFRWSHAPSELRRHSLRGQSIYSGFMQFSLL